MGFTFMKRPGAPGKAPAARAPAGGNSAGPSSSTIDRVYLREVLYRKRGKPAEASDAEIRATMEYWSYMNDDFVWQWELHVTEAEAIRACRLILEDLTARERVSWPRDARKYIYSVRAIAGMQAATPQPAVAAAASTTAVGPTPAEPTPVPDPWRGERPPVPEPSRPGPSPQPDPPARTIVTPPVKPSKEEQWRKRLENAERLLEDLRGRGDKLADEVEKHVKNVRDILGIATGALAAGVIFIYLPGGVATGVALAELASELDEIDKIREGLQEYGPQDAQRLGIKRMEHHHVFPQEHRAWFEERGLEIDDYTLALDDAEHDVIHLLGWNDKIMEALQDRERRKGGKLTHEEIVREGRLMMESMFVDGPFVPYHGKDGDPVEE